MADHNRKRPIQTNRSRIIKDANLQVAVTTATHSKMRLQAAMHDMSLSSYVYEILKLATNNFSTLNLVDIERSLKKEDDI